MSLFDSASLVITPNGTKASKLYAIKPTDASGDLSVTRATTATRVNSSGLVELVPYNIYTYSEQFNNAVWDKVSVTVNPDTTVSPNGSTTADTLVISSSGYLYRQVDYTSVVGDSITMSIYTKNSDANFLRFANSTIAGTDSNEIINVGNGWYRHIVTRTFTTATTGIIQFLLGFSFTGNYYIWGAQLVTGTSAKEYFPTTDRLNVPRLDYTNSTCPSILVEPQRTNLNTYSEDFTNGIYTNQNTTISANNTTAPDGTATADKLVITGSGVTSIHREVTTTSGNYYTTSVYAKKAETQYINLGFIYNSSVYAGTQFDLNNGTIKRNDSSSYTGLRSTITNVGNGWYRLTLACIINTATAYPCILPSNTSWTSGEPNQNLTGNNTTGAYFWGLQMELGSYATSYIPTVASSVTRNADVISKTGISSLIGQTEGTIFLDMNLSLPTATQSTFFSLIGNSSWLNNSFYFDKLNNNKISFSSVKSSAGNGAITSTNAFTNQRVKIALRYSGLSIKMYINGNLEASGSLTNQLAVIDRVYLNELGTLSQTSNYQKNNYNSISIFKTALTETECINLTTI